MYEKIKSCMMTAIPVAITVVCLGLLGYTLKNQYDIETNPPILKDFKDGIQNHLMWDNKGKCYFVRPYTDYTNYLIAVPDCDRR